MRKLFTPILTGALIVLMSTAAFAADADTASPSGSQPAQVQQVNSEQKAKRAEFKSQVAPLRAERKANREENLALREQNKTLYAQIKSKLEALKSSETKLTEEQKTELKTLRADVKALRTEIKATEGQVKAILEADKENIKNMNLEAVQAAFNKVFEIQTYRHDRLVQINAKLGQIVSTLG